MKLLNDQTAEHQAELLNLSLKAVVFLDSLNITKSIPIHGKDSKLKFSNYTPASLLFNLDKMFENLIGNKIVYFLEEKKGTPPQAIWFSKRSIDRTCYNLLQKKVKLSEIPGIRNHRPTSYLTNRS